MGTCTDAEPPPTCTETNAKSIEIDDADRLRNRTSELERVVSAQTEQVKFLAAQLQRVVGPNRCLPTTNFAAQAQDMQDDSSCPDDDAFEESSSDSDERI